MFFLKATGVVGSLLVIIALVIALLKAPRLFLPDGRPTQSVADGIPTETVGTRLTSPLDTHRRSP